MQCVKCGNFPEVVIVSIANVFDVCVHVETVIFRDLRRLIMLKFFAVGSVRIVYL